MFMRCSKFSRSIRRFLYFWKRATKFKLSYASNGEKIGFFGIIICFLSLFFPWISSLDGIAGDINGSVESFWAFSKILGFTWVFIFLTLLVVGFSIFSIRRKERLRFFSLVHISEYSSCLIWSLFISILCIQKFFLISWLQVFSSNILYGKWIILCLTWSFFILIAAIIIKTEYRKKVHGSYIYEERELRNIENTPEDKNNMKLPF